MSEEQKTEGMSVGKKQNWSAIKASQTEGVWVEGVPADHVLVHANRCVESGELYLNCDGDVLTWGLSERSSSAYPIVKRIPKPKRCFLILKYEIVDCPERDVYNKGFHKVQITEKLANALIEAGYNARIEEEDAQTRDS